MRRWKILRFRWRIYNWLSRWRLTFAKNESSLQLPVKIVKGEYPNNTRYVQTEKHLHSIIVESQAGNRTVFINGSKAVPICLYFPYAYFLIHYVESHQKNILGQKVKKYVVSGMYVGFSHKRIDSTNGSIGKLPLTNYQGDFNFCLGTGNVDNGPYDNIREMAEAHISAFWKSSFEMQNEGDIKFWRECTKQSIGQHCVKSFINSYRKSEFHQFGIRKNEQFFQYQQEQCQQACTSRDRPNRRKRRKGVSRKT